LRSGLGPAKTRRYHCLRAKDSRVSIHASKKEPVWVKDFDLTGKGEHFVPDIDGGLQLSLVECVLSPAAEEVLHRGGSARQVRRCGLTLCIHDTSSRSRLRKARSEAVDQKVSGWF
jgi:hypothetical protein